MSDIEKLKDFPINLTVLCVEDSSTILKQVGNFLEKFFKKVYLANDGFKGLESYKLNKPNLVITDIVMPNMDGYELIKNLRKINPKVKVIIISSHYDTDSLLKAIRVGVSDFITKPIDNLLFQNALLKVIKKLQKKETKLSKKDFEKENTILSKLFMLSKSHIEIELINHYRGVPIVHNGNIIDTDNTGIIIHAPLIQTLAIKHQGFTVIESELIETAVHAQLSNINPDNQQIRLNNFKSIEFSGKQRKELRIEPDDEFTTIVHIKDVKIDTVINDVSINSISMTIHLQDIVLNKGDEINLTFGFKLYKESQFSTVKTTERLYCKGKVFKINQNDNKPNVVVLFELTNTNQTALKRYIIQREIELIEEFKKLRKGYGL